MIYSNNYKFHSLLSNDRTTRKPKPAIHEIEKVIAPKVFHWANHKYNFTPLKIIDDLHHDYI